MTRRTVLALAVVAVVLLAWGFSAWYASTISHLPPGGDPDQFWSCTTDAINSTTPPPCLTDER